LVLNDEIVKKYINKKLGEKKNVIKIMRIKFKRRQLNRMKFLKKSQIK
jgi:hypothetical protein